MRKCGVCVSASVRVSVRVMSAVVKRTYDHARQVRVQVSV